MSSTVEMFDDCQGFPSEIKLPIPGLLAGATVAGFKFDRAALDKACTITRSLPANGLETVTN